VWHSSLSNEGTAVIPQSINWRRTLFDAEEESPVSGRQWNRSMSDYLPIEKDDSIVPKNRIPV